MNDLELCYRLRDLGMPKDQAWQTAALIRDNVHPVAAVAAAKLLKATGAPGLDGLGASAAITLSTTMTGAKIGSVIPGVGTAIGAAVGLVAGLMIHQGQGAQRAAVAAQLNQALAQIPSAYVGRTIPWNENNHGLQQFLQSIMTAGVWFGWDGALSSPSVNGHWAQTFITAVKQVVAAIVANPPGATISLNITDKPGGNDARPGNFTFVNPGIAAGPDYISQNIIMGINGLMYWMVLRTGETVAHAQSNAINGAAERVFALMVDHATADLVPNSLSNSLANAPIVPVPAPIAAQANQVAAKVAASGTVPTLTAGGGTVANISAPTPIAAPVDQYPPQYAQTNMPATAVLTPQQEATAGIMQQMMAQQGANFVSPAGTQLMADVAANGVEATPGGPSMFPAWLLPVGLAGAVVVVVMMLKKKKAA